MHRGCRDVYFGCDSLSVLTIEHELWVSSEQCDSCSASIHWSIAQAAVNTNTTSCKLEHGGGRWDRIVLYQMQKGSKRSLLCSEAYAGWDRGVKICGTYLHKSSSIARAEVCKQRVFGSCRTQNSKGVEAAYVVVVVIGGST